ncbi:membrane dipeptidase [Hymenobacter sp. BT507]|uniref:Membrane dipeptidase n=1 Tax=Hymenobacter citatus TaxID=2763506 RepID=A0ABR7MFM5_9BACT|nr:membrane dipeptidase [Hymenobacter citatus]MBC6609462.1 membrane dipeptidase [Hymenobacter citatus]
MLIVDAHLDLSMNALEWNRDLTQPVAALNAREAGLTDKPDRGNAVVSLPELRRGQIGLVVATQIARFVAPENPLPGWHSPAQAWAQTQGQLAWYQAMEAAGEMVQVHNLPTLEQHLALWTDDSTPAERKPIGYILSLEGADSLITVEYLEQAYRSGLRAVGPAHYGPGRYAQGTDATGRMGPEGHALLREMERLNIILDATHLCDDSFWDALDHFNGPVWASHNNCRALVDHNRQYSDAQLKALIAHGAVIGGALDAWMMVPNWVRGESTPVGMQCNLEVLVDHLDHICQLAGNTLHVGIGSDLDGAFGREQCPYDLETIADLQHLPDLLAKRGYTAQDVENLLHGNWLRFLRRAWA